MSVSVIGTGYDNCDHSITDLLCLTNTIEEAEKMD